MKSIGIIGVGGIARAVVEGLCAGAEEPPEIFLSPRGAQTAAGLAERHPTVRVCADNQEVADRGEVVIVAVRAEQCAEALAGLRIAADRVVINVMAGVGIDDLSRVLDTDAPQVRAMPLQAVHERRCVTVVYPSHPDVNAIFDRLGGALPVADEAVFNVFGVLTGTMSAHFAYLAALVGWVGRQGIPSRDADRFVRSLFEGVGRALGDETRSLEQLMADHETPKGINERIRMKWFESACSRPLENELDALHDDLERSRLGTD